MTRNARRRASATLLVLAVGAPFALHASACGGGAHVYSGRLYLEARDCVTTESSLDVVEGEPTGTCEPLCLTQPEDGGRSVYVATMCPPYPYGFDTSGQDPTCAAALAALARRDTCLSDGGSTSPLEPDAGEPDASEPDAGT